jgi:hypothetical protein
MTLALKNRRKVVQLLTTTGMLRPDQTAGQRRILARSRGLKVSLIIQLLRGSLSPWSHGSRSFRFPTCGFYCPRDFYSRLVPTSCIRRCRKYSYATLPHQQRGPTAYRLVASNIGKQIATYEVIHPVSNAYLKVSHPAGRTE